MRTPGNDTRPLEGSVRPERRRDSAEVEGRLAQPRGNRPSTSLRTNGDGDLHQPERTCVLTRRKGARSALIRLALGPDGQVAPDVRARAAGRGAWISVTRAELDEANSRGRLKAALARAFKTSKIDIPPNLGELTERALRQSALDRLGMEARAGNLINGAERVETAARSGRVHLLIHAADAGEDGRRRLDQAWRVGGGEGQGLIFPEGRSILSMALGRENVVHVALTDPAAAARAREALARWSAFIHSGAGPQSGAPARRTGSTNAHDEGTE
ncbi:MAG TPA: DUF448 domain-containing protein [Sphingomicrobium sp.]|nr:DUF448 domain-containing protein [Sphingomicrobium sp.]